MNDLAVLVGLCWIPLAFSIWCWLGRSKAARWWVGGVSERLALTIFPSWGIIGTAASLSALLKNTPVTPVTDYVVLVLVLLGAAIGFWGCLLIPIPRWWGPGWFRRLTAKERKRKTKRALDALVVSATRAPAEVSRDIATKRFGAADDAVSWRANYVFDADATGRDHGLGVPGAVYGKLTAYAQGLGFAASKTEDALRERSTVVAIDAATITGFRVVPARAGADGVVRPKRPRQSRFPRLVVDTSNGSHVFELSHAADVAETLRQAFAGI